MTTYYVDVYKVNGKIAVGKAKKKKHSSPVNPPGGEYVKTISFTLDK